MPWIPYQEELATFLGVQPRPWRTLFTDFELGKALLFNPPTTAAFRLTGPHKWAGARDFVINSNKRLKKALSPIQGDSSLSLALSKTLRLLGYCVIIAFTIFMASIFSRLYLEH